MTEGLISIIVPVYNVEKYLRDCLDSIACQSYKNIEIILIDDGSEDKSGEICDEYVSNDNRFFVIHKENEGVSVARNTALRFAKGEYVGFVDSDDTIEKDMFLNLYNSCKDNNSDICICNVNVFENGKNTGAYISELVDRRYNKGEIFKDMKNISGVLWNKLFYAGVIKGLEFDSDIRFGEDMLFVIQSILKSNTITAISYYGYNYNRTRAGNVMSSSLQMRHISFLDSGYKVCNLLIDKGADEKKFGVFFIANSIDVVMSIGLKSKKIDCGTKKNMLRKIKRNLFELQKPLLEERGIFWYIRVLFYTYFNPLYRFLYNIKR